MGNYHPVNLVPKSSAATTANEASLAQGSQLPAWDAFWNFLFKSEQDIGIFGLPHIDRKAHSSRPTRVYGERKSMDDLRFDSRFFLRKRLVKKRLLEKKSKVPLKNKESGIKKEAYNQETRKGSSKGTEPCQDESPKSEDADDVCVADKVSPSRDTEMSGAGLDLDSPTRGIRPDESPADLCTIGFTCLKGQKADLNQDNFFGVVWNGSKEFLLGVFDGHGPKGEVFSELGALWTPLVFLRDPNFAQENKKTKETLEERGMVAMESSFKGLSKIASQKLSDVKCQKDNPTLCMSGTTCVVVYGEFYEINDEDETSSEYESETQPITDKNAEPAEAIEPTKADDKTAEHGTETKHDKSSHSVENGETKLEGKEENKSEEIAKTVEPHSKNETTKEETKSATSLFQLGSPKRLEASPKRAIAPKCRLSSRHANKASKSRMGYKLSVGWLGDSRCLVIVTSNIAPTGHFKLETVQSLTRDHKPENSEAERLQEGWTNKTTKNQGFIKKQRVWFTCDSANVLSGLNMSRSLGDQFAHDVGVSSEPEIETANLMLRQDRDHFILLASDGLFEVFENEAVGEMIVHCLNESMSLQDTVNYLAQKAVNEWLLTNASAYCDDVTIVLYVP